MTLLCGLIGLPPANGVLPQSPMHTKSLAVLKRQLIRKKMVKSAKECIKQQGSNSEIYGRMQAGFIETDTTPDHAVAKELKNLKDAVMKSEDGGSKDGNDLEKHIDAHLPVRVNEQRVSNLLQSLLVGASLLAMPASKMIPTSVLWDILPTWLLTASLETSSVKEFYCFLLHLKGGTTVNYIAISEALGLSPSVLAAGVAADNVICALYFVLLFALASKIPSEAPASTNDAATDM